VNLSKTKIMIFNTLRGGLSDHFFFKGNKVEINIDYTYVDVKFSSLNFILSQPSLGKGYKALFMMECQCFHTLSGHLIKIHLFDLIIKPTMLNDVKLWGPNLFPLNWSCMELV